jgi:hypothetical protein
MSKFIKILEVGDEPINAEGQTDRHNDECDSRFFFPKFYEIILKFSPR